MPHAWLEAVRDTVQVTLIAFDLRHAEYHFDYRFECTYITLVCRSLPEGVPASPSGGGTADTIR